MSDSPFAIAVKRTAEVTDWYSILSGSPKTAAETARQFSTSKPDHLPLSDSTYQPGAGVPSWQRSWPRFLTISSVLCCADAGSDVNVRADRKCVMWGKSVAVRVDLGGR